MIRLIKYGLGLIGICAILFFVGSYFNFFGRHLVIMKSSFKHLPGWQNDDQSKAFIAFKNSCDEINSRNPLASFSSLAHSGQVKNWQTICAAAIKLNHPTSLEAREFFETWFTPYTIKNYLNSKGLFTGYYLPELSASFKKSAQYTIPIYGLPNDLVKVNLKSFQLQTKKSSLVGQLKNNEIKPYPDRASISQGAIDHHAPIILWANNAVDVFFAQIQGSAIVNLPDHKQLLINYAGDNGRLYTPIGKILIKQKFLERKNVTMQTIRDWLMQHPDQINTILNQDASYVFFYLTSRQAPIGTEKIPLTAERSLAIDLHYLALGLPVWLDTSIPQQNSKKTAAYKHLLVAQDTGGAINGIVRGDIYWGAGENAAFTAGNMKNSGKYWVLLPKGLTKR